MSPRPLIAVEDPPDFPSQGRTHRYTVIDAARNRVVGRIRGEQIGLSLEHWVWAVTVPPAVGVGSLTPSGKVASRAEALADFKGVGPWTVGMVAVRGAGDPDVFPTGDLGLERTWATLPSSEGKLNDAAAQWRPWRSYAANLLWRSYTP